MRMTSAVVIRLIEWATSMRSVFAAIDVDELQRTSPHRNYGRFDATFFAARSNSHQPDDFHAYFVRNTRSVFFLGWLSIESRKSVLTWVSYSVTTSLCCVVPLLSRIALCEWQIALNRKRALHSLSTATRTFMSNIISIYSTHPATAKWRQSQSLSLAHSLHNHNNMNYWVARAVQAYKRVNTATPSRPNRPNRNDPTKHKYTHTHAHNDCIFSDSFGECPHAFSFSMLDEAE